MKKLLISIIAIFIIGVGNSYSQDHGNDISCVNLDTVYIEIEPNTVIFAKQFVSAYERGLAVRDTLRVSVMSSTTVSDSLSTIMLRNNERQWVEFRLRMLDAVYLYYKTLTRVLKY